MKLVFSSFFSEIVFSHKRVLSGGYGKTSGFWKVHPCLAGKKYIYYILYVENINYKFKKSIIKSKKTNKKIMNDIKYE